MLISEVAAVFVGGPLLALFGLGFNEETLSGLAILPTSLAIAAAAALIAHRLGPYTILTGRIRLVIAMMLPVTAVLLYDELDRQRSYEDHTIAGLYYPLTTGIWVWAVGLATALFAAAALRRRGRKALAWTTGAAGALVVTDLAVVVASLQAPSASAGLSALYWFSASLLGQDNLHVWNDNYSVYMLICSGYALGYVMAAMRPRHDSLPADLTSRAVPDMPATFQRV